jgi:hypothetical protein
MFGEIGSVGITRTFVSTQSIDRGTLIHHLGDSGVG